MFTTELPDTVMDKLKEYFSDQQCSIKESEKKYKIQAGFSTYEEQLVVNAKVEKTEEGAYCIRLEKALGNKMDFLEVFNEVRTSMEGDNLIL